MDHGFAIDNAFAEAVGRWRTALNGTASNGRVSAFELHGAAESLVPSILVVATEHGRTSIEVGGWPADLPSNRTQLRKDPRVWRLFTTEWSMGEIRDYLELGPQCSDDEVRASFVSSAWWHEFEAMVVEAFAYEWRAALEELKGDVGARLIVAHPEPEESSLLEYGARLNRAASVFEATTFDAELLYGRASRIAAFLHASISE